MEPMGLAQRYLLVSAPEEGKNAREKGKFMSLAERVTAHLPYLRRFARAVTGSQKSGDAYVASTLEAILADPSVFSQTLPPRVALYRTFLKILGSIKWNNEKPGDSPSPGLEAAQRNLEVLTPRARQAFLLVSVEEFSPEDAAAVMDIEAGELQRLVDEAGRDIARQIATDVVIIEDEPLIALDLERLVTALGHRVVKIARTERQAIEAVKRARPGLVLADILLADGSSGLDAVNEILRTFSVPVIFVTAYPQRLLTGTRPEPTFLITKPFHPDNVKAIISQALFFDIRGRPEQPRLAAV
jgi:DNA-directed RNA polymerase specialized sigma24 family protein/CheY-like chemotaxis protein